VSVRARAFVFVDGRHVPALSTPAELTGGARAGSLAAALRTGADSELARTHLARHARWRDSAFAALNTAFLADGAFVHVSRRRDARSAAGVGLPLDRPIGIRRIDRVAPRSLIVVERSARAAVVETYAGLSDGVY